MTAGEATRTTPVVTVAGRLVSNRVMGKLAFAHIEDGSGKIQLFLRRDEIGDETFQLYKKAFDLGDFVEAKVRSSEHEPAKSASRLHNFGCWQKLYHPLPIPKEYEDENGQITRNSAFSDVEERYRQRYADLAVNPKVRDVFRTRSRMVSALRTWLDDQGLSWKWKHPYYNQFMVAQQQNPLPPITINSNRTCIYASRLSYISNAYWWECTNVSMKLVAISAMKVYPSNTIPNSHRLSCIALILIFTG